MSWFNNKESEKNTEPALVRGVKERKGICLKWVSPGFTGVPDRICLYYPGVIHFVETKSQGDKPKPRQDLVHKVLRRLGFKVYVISTKEQLKNYFDEVDSLQLPDPRLQSHGEES